MPLHEFSLVMILYYKHSFYPGGMQPDEILRLIVALKVKQSNGLTTPALLNSNLLSTIKLNTVAPEQNEQLGHGHHPFFPIL